MQAGSGHSVLKKIKTELDSENVVILVDTCWPAIAKMVMMIVSVNAAVLASMICPF